MSKNLVPPVVAFALLLLVVAGTEWIRARHDEALKTAPPEELRDSIPDTAGLKAVRLVFHDFEYGDPADTAQRLAANGHNSRQSFRLSPRAPFSPGLWIRFSELGPGKYAWLRATGYVWFGGRRGEALCSLVATCNQEGVNYKYQSVAVEKQPVGPGRWNRIRLDYRIPLPASAQDVLQVYFWYRGSGEMLLDNLEVTAYKAKHVD